MDLKNRILAKAPKSSKGQTFTEYSMILFFVGIAAYSAYTGIGLGLEAAAKSVVTFIRRAVGSLGLILTVKPGPLRVSIWHRQLRGDSSRIAIRDRRGGGVWEAGVISGLLFLIQEPAAKLSLRKPSILAKKTEDNQTLFAPLPAAGKGVRSTGCSVRDAS